jgi:GNAT superfamily N-acetyltransferase
LKENEPVKRLSIRSAKPEDAASIIHVHYAAVHGIGPEFYPPEVIEDWSRKPDEARYKWMRELIAQGESIVIVGEEQSSILGFGIVIPKLMELQALYVSPAASGQGVGPAILRELENRAASQGIARLQLNASLNAAVFYRRHGYETLSHSALRLSDEHEMECIRMGKDL